MRRILWITVCAVTLPLVAAAAPDANNGSVLAQRWCSSCHATGRPERRGDGAPAFASIAQHGQSDPERFRAWLRDPHPPMPNPGLSPDEIDDVIAYLQQFAPPR
jgi:mono/diheme cytochrome c family protein